MHLPDPGDRVITAVGERRTIVDIIPGIAAAAAVVVSRCDDGTLRTDLVLAGQPCFWPDPAGGVRDLPSTEVKVTGPPLGQGPPSTAPADRHRG